MTRDYLQQRPYPTSYTVDGIVSRLFCKENTSRTTVFVRKFMELIADHTCGDVSFRYYGCVSGDRWQAQFDDRTVDLDYWMKYGTVKVC